MDGPVAILLIIGGSLYFLGVFIVSMVGNIPMNRALEALPQGGHAAQAYWPDYVKGWVLWNHRKRLVWLPCLRPQMSDSVHDR